VRTAAASIVVATLLVLGAGPAPGAASSPSSLLDVGDSLSVGSGPFLQKHLRGYRIEHVYDVGLHAYDAARIVSTTHPLPATIVVSAGTNDDPRIVATFIRSVSAILSAAGPTRCVVWPSIVRPPAVGASYAGINHALERAAARHGNLVLVDWVRMVHEHPWWVAGDGVHVSVAGYRARAGAIARAVVNRCP
jgi:hypothetical protein